MKILDFKTFVSTKCNKVREIKYFSPDGRDTVPNGIHYQKGEFFKACKKNFESFQTFNFQYLVNKDYVVKINENLLEGLHQNQYNLTKYPGGIIVFSVDVNSVSFSKNKIIDFLKKKIETLKNKFFHKSKITKAIDKVNKSVDEDEFIGAFSIGNFFKGRYISDKGQVFDETSVSIEINGISSKVLIKLAEEIAREFVQETVLVKDLNAQKVYLVDPISKNYDVQNL